MGSEEPTDLKGMKDIGSKIVVKKQLPKKFRELPEHYFLPRPLLRPYEIVGIVVAGIGAAMLVEAWMKKKTKEILDRERELDK